jgi:uncharacterized membrane protein YgaE (UPF0421/DUF939 family)
LGELSSAAETSLVGGVMKLFDEQSIRQTLASYDAEEAKMRKQIAYYAKHGPVSVHNKLLWHQMKSLAQIEVRRNMLKKMLLPDTD